MALTTRPTLAHRSSTGTRAPSAPHPQPRALELTTAGLQTLSAPRQGALRTQAGQYAQAWECATVNRMDQSLIAAHAWPRFLAAAPAFVAAVPKDQDLVDFLTSLQPHDARSGLAVQLKDSEQVCSLARCALRGGCADGRQVLPCLWCPVQPRWNEPHRTCMGTARCADGKCQSHAGLWSDAVPRRLVLGHHAGRSGGSGAAGVPGHEDCSGDSASAVVSAASAH